MKDGAVVVVRIEGDALQEGSLLRAQVKAMRTFAVESALIDRPTTTSLTPPLTRETE